MLLRNDNHVCAFDDLHENAMTGHMTEKVDVFPFGVVAL
jgi:hypothetical protein